MQKLDEPALDLLFREARSFDRFYSRPVGDATLRALWDLTKMGPTSANQMPARFVWCVSEEARTRLAACASRANADKILGAPVTVVIGMDEDFHDLLPELFPAQDARSWFADPAARRLSALRNGTLQGAYLIFAARSLGLDVGPMSGFDAAAVEAAFFADAPSVRANFLCAIGYGERDGLTPRNPKPAFERFNRIA